MWANRSCHSLKKNNHDCSLLKSNMNDLLFFTSESHFRSQKRKIHPNFFLFFLGFWPIFTAFPLFYAQRQITLVALYKRVTVILKRTMWAIWSFSWANQVIAVLLTKKRIICSKNRWANSQPWFLNQNRRKIWPIPNCTQGKQHEMQIFLKSLKLTHPVVYTVHFT